MIRIASITAIILLLRVLARPTAHAGFDPNSREAGRTDHPPGRALPGQGPLAARANWTPMNGRWPPPNRFGDRRRQPQPATAPRWCRKLVCRLGRQRPIPRLCRTKMLKEEKITCKAQAARPGSPPPTTPVELWLCPPDSNDIYSDRRQQPGRRLRPKSEPPMGTVDANANLQ